MNEKVTLNVKEQKRLLVLNEILAGRMTGQEAAEVLGLSLRHTRRIIAAYRKEGAAVQAHGNRGKPSHRRTPKAVEEEIVALAKGPYTMTITPATSPKSCRSDTAYQSLTPRCGGSDSAMGCRVHAKGGCLVIEDDGSAIPRLVCCYKWMAASMTGWKDVDHG